MYSSKTSSKEIDNPITLPTITKLNGFKVRLGIAAKETHCNRTMAISMCDTTFTQGKPNLVNDPIDVSSDTSLSLPETLSLPSNPSLTQISQTPFPPKFPTNLAARYREISTNNIHLRLVGIHSRHPLDYLDNIKKVTDYTTGH